MANTNTSARYTMVAAKNRWEEQGFYFDDSLPNYGLEQFLYNRLNELGWFRLARQPAIPRRNSSLRPRQVISADNLSSAWMNPESFVRVASVQLLSARCYCFFSLPRLQRRVLKDVHHMSCVCVSKKTRSFGLRLNLFVFGSPFEFFIK
ncbi:hypothetical protein V6N11_055933 [Hibiscus sabdariffa]|uniref:Uncharacterized protein n=1 Tax=Hibiscus sabdariffa TaxID=183260 RepID=A0ABR2T2W2_9ROSI